ncbi:MAG: beta strand repeat-containing protein [Mycobacteriales bacterium]
MGTAEAANARTAVSLVNVSESPTNAGAQAAYTVNFTTSSTGVLAAGSGTITLAAPATTVFPATGTPSVDNAYLINGVAADTVVGGGTHTVTLTVPDQITANEAVTVVASPVTTNTAPPGAGNTLDVSTSADTTAVAGTFTTTTASANTQTSTVVVTPSSDVGGASTSYEITFKPTTALAGSATITLAAPTGTTLPTSAADYTVNGGSITSVSGSGATVTLTLPASFAAAAASTVTVEILSGVTNPPNPSSSTTTLAEVLDLSTNADTLAEPSQPYPIVPVGTSVTGVTVSLSNTASNQADNYTVDFTTSSTGALTVANSDSITLTLPTGTNTGTATSATVNGTPSTIHSHVGSTIVIDTLQDVGNSSPVALVVDGITNTATPGSYTLSVNTSEDTNPVSSPSFAIVNGSSVTAGTVTPSPASAGATATYTVTFTPTTAVPSSGTITFTAPSGTVFSSGLNYTVAQGANAATPASGTLGASSDSVTITTPFALTGGSVVTVVASNVTNPAAGSYSSATTPFTVNTSTDPNPVDEPLYTITAVNSVTPGALSVSPTAAGTTVTTGSIGDDATYTVDFTTSHALTAGQDITLTADGLAGTDPGTVFPSAATAYSVNGIPVITAPTLTGTDVTAIPVPQAIAADQAVSVVVAGVENPQTVGRAQTVSVFTATDTTAINESNTVTLTAVLTSVTAVTIDGTSGSSGDAGATHTYTIGFTPTTTVSSGGTVTVSLAAGTVLPTAGSAYNLNPGGTVTFPSAVSVSGSSVTLTLPSGFSYTTAVAVTLTITGATNPTLDGGYNGSVATSVDTAPAQANYYVDDTLGNYPSTAVSQPTVSPNPATAGATAVYTVNFHLSPQGAMGTPTGKLSYIFTLANFPTTTLPTAFVTVNGIQDSASYAAGTLTVDLNTGQFIAGGGAVSIVVPGVTNPAASTTNTITVHTDSDSAPIVSADYTTTSTGAPVVSSVTPTSGPTSGGTTVTISGANFAGTTTVAFGNTLATFTVVNSTTITASSPAESAGTVNVVVTNATGASATSTSDQFTYSAPSFVAELPIRILDTRSGSGDSQGLPSPLLPGTVYNVQVAGNANVPANAVAVAFNVTAVEPSGNGNLRVFPDNGAAAPTASNINYITGQTVANYDIVALPANGKISIETFGSSVNVLLDVTGYFNAGSPYTPQAPARILDTRSGSGFQQGITGPIQPGTVESIQVSGMGGVPSTATSVSLNVTAVEPAGNGNLRVFPDTTPGSTTAPNASTINYNSPQSSANFDIVQVPSDGKVDVETFGAAVNVVIDVEGYSTTGITNQTPVRILDTRSTSQIGSITGPVQPGTVESVTVAGVGGVPSNAQAVLMNVTSVEPGGNGNLRIYPDTNGGGTTAAPGISNINYIPTITDANFVIVQLPSDGKVDFESFGSATNVLFDVVGYIPAGG